MKFFFNMLVVVLVVLGNVNLVFADMPLTKEVSYETPYGVVTLRWSFEGGVRSQMLTVKGPSSSVGMQVSMTLRPDGSQSQQGEWALGDLESIVVEGKKVFLVTDSGVWQWLPDKMIFGRVMTFTSVKVHKRFATADGDIYSLLPSNGDAEFRGLLYFERKAGAWILAEYLGKKKLDAAEVRYAAERFQVVHRGFPDMFQFIASITIYNPVKRIFVNADGESEALLTRAPAQ